jgi:MFS family permease
LIKTSSSVNFYYGYWIILAGFLTQFVAVGMANYVAGSFMIPMTEEFGWSRTEFSASRSIGQMVLALTGFAIGAQIDKHGGRRFILIGSFVLSGSVFSMSLVQTLPQWLFGNGLMLTMGAALVGNLVVNVTLGKWFVERRGRAVSIAAMGISLSGMILPIGATWLIDNYSWQAAWQVLGLGTLIVTFPAALVVRRAPEDYGLYPDGKTKSEVADGQGIAANLDFDNSLTRAEAIRSPSFYALVIAFGLFQISITVMLLQSIPLMTDAGYTRFIASAMISLASVPAFLSKPIWGYLIDQYSPKKLASLGAALTGMSILVVVYSVWTRNDYLIYFGFITMGIGWGGLLPLQEVIWATFFGRRFLGAVRSAALPFVLGMSSVGPVLVATYYDRMGDYYGALSFIALCNLFSAVMLFRIKDRHE